MKRKSFNKVYLKITKCKLNTTIHATEKSDSVDIKYFRRKVPNNHRCNTPRSSTTHFYKFSIIGQLVSKIVSGKKL